ncbi:MAG: hypothetical protein R3A13_02735 [Bdellovibrionota bacterium]
MWLRKKEATTAPLFESKIKQGCENPFRVRSSSQNKEVEKRLNLSFSVTENTQSLIDEAKRVLSGKLPKGATLEDLFEGLRRLLLRVSVRLNRLVLELQE